MAEDSSMFLSRDEIAMLTGRKHRALQIAQLRREGIPFRLNAAGWPIVCRAHVEGREKETTIPAWRPNLVA